METGTSCVFFVLWSESHWSGKSNKLKWFVVNYFKNVLIMETKTSFATFCKTLSFFEKPLEAFDSD